MASDEPLSDAPLTSDVKMYSSCHIIQTNRLYSEGDDLRVVYCNIHVVKQFKGILHGYIDLCCAVFIKLQIYGKSSIYDLKVLTLTTFPYKQNRLKSLLQLILSMLSP